MIFLKKRDKYHKNKICKKDDEMKKINEIIEELEQQDMDANSKVFYTEDEKNSILDYYRQALSALFLGKKNEVLEKFHELSNLKLFRNIPYSIFFNEIEFIKNKVANEILLKKDANKLFELFELFKEIENSIAKILLNSYTQELKIKNALRIRAIEIFKEKKIIKYYEHHLDWLNNLALSIQNLDINLFPQTNSKLCEFGKWLDNEGKMTISNNSQYITLKLAHDKLHQLSSRIKSHITSKKEIEYMLILSMLQKCEYISIDIGIELSFIKSSEYMQKAHYDTLTNVLNRNYLDDIYENEFKLAKLTGKRFSVAMCDLDHFKTINDTYGHDIGDIVLKSFATFLKSTLRETDYIIRYGGEEFVIIFPSTSIENGIKLLERFREKLEHFDIETNTKIINIAASFGIIEVDPNDSDRYEFNIENSIRKVDEKLYLAKKNGRNRIEF